MTYQVFISGEAIDLCVPAIKALSDGWADWFNDPETTRFLEQGRFPNLAENQKDFYDSIINKDRFVLMIKPKHGDAVVGTISLSNVDFEKRSCQISMLIGAPSDRSKNEFYALESMARVIEHAFLQLGMDRVWAGQSYPSLAKWNKHLELIGFRSEGILEDAFVKGRLITDTVNISCLYKNYHQIKNVRDGNFWPGTAKIRELIKQMPETGFADILNREIKELQKNYFNNIKYT